MYAILRVDTEWCELSILSNNGRKNHKDFGSKYVTEVFFSPCRMRDETELIIVTDSAHPDLQLYYPQQL